MPREKQEACRRRWAGAFREKALPILLKRHGEESRYADARRAEGPRRLAVVARDAYRLVERFRGDGSEEYRLLERLVREQCEVLTTEVELGQRSRE